MTQEIRSLTGLRGIAAFWVVIYHFHQTDRLGGFAGQLIGHGYLAVDCFFILSGFVMALSYRDLFKRSVGIDAYKVFLIRRVARVWPLYAVTTCGFAMLLGSGLGSGRLRGEVITLLPVNLLMVQAWGIGDSINHPAWSISVEFFAYLAFPILSRLILFQNFRVGLFFGAACISLLGLLAWLRLDTFGNGPLDLTDPHTMWPLLRCISEFSLGMFAYSCFASMEGRPLAHNRVATLLLTTLIIILLCLAGTDLLVVILLPVFLILISVDDWGVARMLGSRVVHSMGLISYAVYLLHWGFLPLRTVSTKMTHWLPQIVADFISLGLIYGLLVVAATLAYRLIEKPGRRWISRLAGARSLRERPFNKTNNVSAPPITPTHV